MIRHGTSWLMLTATVLLCACSSTPPAPVPDQETSAATFRNADQLLVVDCLLPGQIRKLGQFATYLSPRRPIKTSAGDCELRGGEYVAYDRANYGTALKMWLPPAQAGDPVAQTYVGEIYERGLGIAPDYALAASWYRKAAKQGYSRAQVNLGFLYEQGLGVGKDPVAAINWYRKASGLTDDRLAYASSIDTLKAERQAADQEVALRRQESQRLKGQLQQTQQQLQSQTRDLEATKRELKQTREQMQQIRSTPSNAPGGVDTSALDRRLAEQQRLLEQQHEKLGFLKQEADLQQAQLTAELNASKRRERELRDSVAAQAQERESLQRQVEAMQATLAEYESELAARNSQLENQRVALERTEQVLERERRITANANSAEIQRLEEQLGARSAELAETEGQIEALKAAVEKRQEKLAQLRASTPANATRGGSGEPVTAAAEAERVATHPLPPFGRYYALIIGNNRYAAFPDLDTAVADAEAMAGVLRSRYGFTTRVLLNADRYTILSALNEFREKLTDKDNFLLYYAGHGELDRANARGNWLPVDAEPNSTANWISNVEITDILNAMSAKHVMVIADSCYSGTLARTVTTFIEGGSSAEKRLAWLKLMINTRSRTVMSSGGLAPVLDSGGGNHSIFAGTLLSVLETNDRILEGPALYQRVAQQVRSNAARLNVDQDPQYAPIRFAGDLGAPFFFMPTS